MCERDGSPEISAATGEREERERKREHGGVRRKMMRKNFLLDLNWHLSGKNLYIYSSQKLYLSNI